jgi:acyl-CoA thioesterase
MTRDELALRVAETMLGREGTGQAWNIDILEAREGFATLSMALRPDMMNGHGSVHGGMIFALADTAFAYACNSRNEAAVAQGASIVFLAPAHVGEVLVAEAQEQAVSGRTGVYSVQVRTQGDGRVIALFHGQSRTIGGQMLDAENQIKAE